MVPVARFPDESCSPHHMTDLLILNHFVSWTMFEVIFFCSVSQVPLFIPALFSFTCLFMVALSLYSDPFSTGIGFVITLTGVPAYYLFIIWDKKPRWFRRMSGKTLKQFQDLLRDQVEENPSMCTYVTCTSQSLKICVAIASLNMLFHFN